MVNLEHESLFAERPIVVWESLNVKTRSLREVKEIQKQSTSIWANGRIYVIICFM